MYAMKWKLRDVFVLAVLVLLPVLGWAAAWEDVRPQEAKPFRAGNLKEVKRIVERSGDFSGGDLETALDFAASSGNVEVMKYLKSRGWLERCRKQDGPCFPLHAAADEGAGTSMLGFLIAEGFQVDQRGPLLMTPMFMAAKSGHLEAVKYLCEAGADPNAKNHEGTSMLQRVSTRLESARLGGKLHPNPKEHAKIKANLEKVIQYLKSDQCKKK